LLFYTLQKNPNKLVKVAAPKRKICSNAVDGDVKQLAAPFPMAVILCVLTGKRNT